MQWHSTPDEPDHRISGPDQGVLEVTDTRERRRPRGGRRPKACGCGAPQRPPSELSNVWPSVEGRSAIRGQALRSAVNDDLGELDRCLADLRGLLAPGGRVVIISFHSLEDRRVKRAFRDAARDCLCPEELPICACGGGHAWLEVLTARPIVPGARELERNPRARSAKLRVARRMMPRAERCPT